MRNVFESGSEIVMQSGDRDVTCMYGNGSLSRHFASSSSAVPPIVGRLLV